MEVQNHGVVFEDLIISKITGFSKQEYQKFLTNAYSHSMDIVKGIYSNEDYSIKVSKNGSGVGCGDILRFNKHTANDNFSIIVGSWNQINPNLKIYREIYEFKIRPEHYEIFWNKINFECLQEFVHWVKSIPPGKTAQLAVRKEWKSRREEIYQKYGQGILSIDAKIDSKNQRRVQCSFKIKDLINSNIEFVKHTTQYQGIMLPYEQLSSPRTFSKT